MKNIYLETYLKTKEKINALTYALYIINWDSETEAPIGSIDEKSKQIGKLVEMLLEVSHQNDYIESLNELMKMKDTLDETTYQCVKKDFENLEKELKIPEEDLIEYQILLSKANNIWLNAKTNNQYEIFEPILEQIINWQKKYIQYLETEDLKSYNVLLNDYEKGFTEEDYDNFFQTLKEELVPFVKEICNQQPINDEFNKDFYAIDKQKEFARYLAKVMCFDEKYGVIKESEHPFTSGYGTTDLRVTNHYYEHLLTSGIFSIIHELGHATYEGQCDSKYDDTPLSGGTTLAMHESQSRFYENIVGRSYAFWKRHYPVLKDIFSKQLKTISLDTFYHAINKVEKSLIRTEADELTYPLHIMVRYDIEKAIFKDNIEAKQLPELWNKLYKEYLDIDVPSDSEGILQDIHWAGGSFGYFPTYALGSAYAAQLYHQMKKEINVDEAFGKENLEDVHHWLKEKVHQFAGSKSPKEILMIATNEEFNPKYYIDYLKDKYSRIYNLKR